MNRALRRFNFAKQLVLRAARDESGAAAVEFGLVLPVLALILLGTLQAGVTLNNYIELTDAVRTGARQLAIGRASSTPYTSATGAVTSAATALTTASLSVTTSVNGAACGSDSACVTALASGVGGTATVRATYPCDLTIMGVDFAPSCTLSSSTTDMVE